MMQGSTRLEDRYGLPVTTNSTKAVEQWVEGLDLLLSYEYGQDERFGEALAADEQFALVCAALALSLMAQGRVSESRAHIERARSLAANVSPRERRQVDVIGLYIDGKGPQSLALLREHLAEFPRDILMLRQAQSLYAVGCSGAGVRNFPWELRSLLDSVESEYGDDWAFLGSYAFAHHETGELGQARRMAERSLEQRPTSAWAAHSVTHVYFETGDHPGGTQFLEDWLPSLDRRAPFHIHLSWHLALAELATGRYQRVLELYEDRIRPAVTAKSIASLSDSASLLWRFQMYGDSPHPPLPWEEVRDLATPAADSPGPASRDAYAAMAFAAAGDREDLGRLLRRLQGLADQGDPLAAEVTVPLVKGIGEFADGAYDDAISLLEPLLGQLTRIGQSHAQREVFEDTLLEAYLRAARFDKAEEMLRSRLAQRPSPRDTYWLGRAQANGGKPDEAAASLRSAMQEWRGADPDSAEVGSLNRLAKRVSPGL